VLVVDDASTDATAAVARECGALVATLPFRLGYGGGYFDRTLAALAPRPLAVGVGFEINRIDSIRPAPHDQRLDWFITEDGAFRPAV